MASEKPTFKLEKKLLQDNYQIIGGTDEVGRGCIFGPVCVGLVVLPLDRDLAELATLLGDIRDSKMLSRDRVYDLSHVVKDVATAWAVGSASAQEIDKVRITGGLKLAIQRAYHDIETQGVSIEYILGDNRMPLEALDIDGHTVRGGDRICFSIACASIIAKSYRDQYVRQIAEDYDDAYGLYSNVGYASKSHMQALRDLGPTPHHRWSFRPIAQPRLFPEDF